MLPFSFLNSMGLPSSKLGFVAKPEMPPHLNVLFRARPPLEYLKPFERPVYKGLEGIIEPDRNYLTLFENGAPPERAKIENYRERKEREWKEKIGDHIKAIKKEMRHWDLQANPNATHDPYKTLVVYRLSKNTTEKFLKQVFRDFGPLKKVALIRDKDKNTRNYAFIEFENVDDFKYAYKHAHKMKIDGKRICVDYERGRTVPGWRPRRFGGGKGNTRTSKRDDERCNELWREMDEEENLLNRDDDEENPAPEAKTEELKAKAEPEPEEKPRHRSRSKEKDVHRKPREEENHYKKRERRHHSKELDRSKEKEKKISRRERSKERYEEHGRRREGGRRNGTKRSESRESGEIPPRK